MKKIFNKGITSFKKNSNSEKDSLDEDINLTNDEYTLLNYLMEENEESLIVNQIDKPKLGLFSTINSTTTNAFNKVTENINNGLVNGKNKVNQLTDVTKDIALKSKDVISSNSNKIIENISSIEKKKLFNKLINSVDLLVIINLLNDVKNKSNINPKQVLAISGLITILSYFENNKQNQEVVENFKDNEEVNNVFKKIPLKEILDSANGIAIFLPPNLKVPFLVIINLLKMFV